MYELVVPLSPIPCPRPRVTSRGWTYYPPKYKQWKKDMGGLLPELLEGAGLEGPLDGPVAVWSTFVCQRPKTTKLAHPKGDIDNFEKSLWDALTDAGAWLDDCQVVASHSEKHWSEPGEKGRIRVVIKCLT
jgi:Holliday junction resolvase RusA-like endonuclease